MMRISSSSIRKPIHLARMAVFVLQLAGFREHNNMSYNLATSNPSVSKTKHGLELPLNSCI
jgi:hypothetical protein